jgi:hypothetical protein
MPIRRMNPHPFPTAAPHPRHPRHLPAFGTFPGTFPYPSPDLGAANLRHHTLPVPGASRTPKFATTSCTPVGNEADHILDASDLAECVIVSSRVLVIHLGLSPLMNTCLSSSLVPI